MVIRCRVALTTAALPAACDIPNMDANRQPMLPRAPSGHGGAGN